MFIMLLTVVQCWSHLTHLKYFLIEYRSLLDHVVMCAKEICCGFDDHDDLKSV